MPRAALTHAEANCLTKVSQDENASEHALCGAGRQCKRYAARIMPDADMRNEHRQVFPMRQMARHAAAQKCVKERELR